MSKTLGFSEIIANYFINSGIEENQQNILLHLIDGVVQMNPEGEAVIENKLAMNSLFKELDLALRVLSAKKIDCQEIPIYFQAMNDIWDAKSNNNLSDKYSLAAPVYGISLISKGYNIFRSPLITKAANEIASYAKSLSATEKSIVIDVGCGIGLQGQILSQLLEEKGVRDKVIVIALDPVDEQLEIAKERYTQMGHKVYDEYYTSKAQDIEGVKELNNTHFDAMLSVGVFGGYVLPEDFSKMLNHTGFSSKTSFFFTTRVFPEKDYINKLPSKSAAILEIEVTKANGYDKALHTSSGQLLNRDYAFVSVNRRRAKNLNNKSSAEPRSPQFS